MKKGFSTYNFIKRTCFACLLVLNFSMTAQINITATGIWDLNVQPTDVFEAGNDYAGTYNSANNQINISVTQSSFFANLLSNYQWRVDVRKQDVNWHTNLRLYARRTGNGNPFWINGLVSGGNNFVELSNTNQILITGNRTRYDIPIQYRLEGVSVLLPVQTYETVIIYTVTEQ